MVLMALDHTRDYFGARVDPTDLATASAALFLTRWVTSFCAPVFFLLTGTGAALSLRRRTRGELAGLLVTRGLWLIVLETVVMRCLAYQMNFDYRVTMLLVLWALGWAMIVLAPLVLLPLPVTLAFGALLVVGHDALDGVRSASKLWVLLHQPGFLVNTPRVVVFDAYPLVPWVGVTALGFCLGRLYAWDAARRRRWLVGLGLAMTLAFVALRYANAYGDPRPWGHHDRPLYTLLSFLNTSKYPPSLSFLLMTLGPALLVLAALERGTPRVLRDVLAIGKVPLAYYVLHFALIHALAIVACLVRYHAVHWMFESPDLGSYPFAAPPGWGFSLFVVYAMWIAVVRMLVPFCRSYAALKARRTDAWLSYV